jgi:hypothetical protein
LPFCFWRSYRHLPHAPYTHGKPAAQVTQNALETSECFGRGRDIFAALEAGMRLAVSSGRESGGKRSKSKAIVGLCCSKQASANA